MYVMHEFMETAIEPMKLGYLDPLTTLTSTSSDVTALNGGEVVTLEGNFNCADTQVNIYEPADPCAAGMHECHRLAKCYPTDDGK